MTIADLLERLKEFDPHSQVLFSCEDAHLKDKALPFVLDIVQVNKHILLRPQEERMRQTRLEYDGSELPEVDHLVVIDLTSQ